MLIGSRTAAWSGDGGGGLPKRYDWIRSDGYAEIQLGIDITGHCVIAKNRFDGAKRYVSGLTVGYVTGRGYAFCSDVVHGSNFIGIISYAGSSYKNIGVNPSQVFVSCEFKQDRAYSSIFSACNGVDIGNIPAGQVDSFAVKMFRENDGTSTSVFGTTYCAGIEVWDFAKTQKQMDLYPTAKDGVGCLYDQINEVFYMPSGEGSVVAGND